MDVMLAFTPNKSSDSTKISMKTDPTPGKLPIPHPPIAKLVNSPSNRRVLSRSIPESTMVSSHSSALFPTAQKGSLR